MTGYWETTPSGPSTPEGRAGSWPSPFSSRAALVLLMAGVLRSDLSDGVVTLTLSRPDWRNALNLELIQALEHEACAQGFCFTTDDDKGAARAFLEKREARFKGA